MFWLPKEAIWRGQTGLCCRDWLGRGQLEPGAGTQVRLVSCQDDSGCGGAALPKQHLKHLRKCVASPCPRDSYRLLPAPASSWGEVGPDTEGRKGRHHVGDGELCLSHPCPPPSLWGTSSSTPGLQSCFCSLYPSFTPPPRGPGMNPFHRRAAKARGAGMADSDAFSRKAGLCTGCRTGGPRAPRSKINKNFKRVTAECGPKHEPPEQDLRGVGFPPFSRGCSGQTPQRGRLDERGAGGDWPRTLVTALTASGASFCQADPRGWWASPRGPRLLDTRAGARLWAA